MSTSTEEDKLNPSAEAARNIVALENDKIEGYDRKSDGLDDHPISAGIADGVEPARTSKNIEDTRARENMGFYRRGNNTQTKGQPERGRAVSLRTIAKKKGPLAALIALGLGLPTVLTILFAPALLLQQLVEVITGEYNDQLAALDIRSQLLLKKKFNDKLTSGCGTVTIRCKYQTIREGSGLAKRLKNAEIEIVGDRSLIPGRIKPKEFIFRGGDPIPADKLLEEASKNPELRTALRKGYDPLYAAFSDKNAGIARTDRMKLKRSSNVESSTDQEKMNEDLKETAAGTDSIPDSGRPLVEGKDEDGNTIYTDPDNPDRVYTDEEGRRINGLIKEGFDREKLADVAKESATKAGLKSVLTTSALGAGAADTMCTAWTIVRIAGYAAKYYQQAQTVRYAYEFMKVAHKQKYGDLTPEEMSYYGNKLTSVNSENKAALDSAGYRFAAYGDSFSPGDYKTGSGSDEEKSDALMVQNETSRYVNGQVLSANVMSKMVDFLSKSDNPTVEKADSSCKFVKSWKGQAIVFGLSLAGLGVAFMSGGASLTWGAAVGAAASVTIAITVALLQPKLIDMAKGEVIKGDENGNETGNAIMAGAGGFNATTAQTRGLRPATQTAYASYRTTTDEIAAKYAEQDSDSKNPLNAMNPNTFLGSIVAKVLPIASKQQSVGQVGLSITSLMGSTLASLSGSKTTSAADEKYSQCDDPDYSNDKYKLATDPFCNVRYALPEPSRDPEATLDYMLKGGPNGPYISETDATPQGDYKDYVERCIERKTAIGDNFTSYKDGTSEGGSDDGEQCVIGRGGANEARNTMFAQFYVDTTIDDGMDNDFEDAVSETATVGAGEFTVASYNILHAVSHTEKSRAIGGCAANPNPDDPTCGKTRALTQSQIIDGSDGSNPKFDIVGTQETSGIQFNELKRLLPGYDAYPDNTERMNNADDGAVAVFWNKEKFTKVSEGKAPGISNTSKSITNPWVGLQTAGGHMVYVMSIHYAISGYGGTDESIKNSARLTAEWVKSKTGDNTTVLVVGDFNDTPSQKNSHCVLTQDSLMIHATDLIDKKSPTAGCTTVPRYNGIDSIYSTPTEGLSAKGWKHPAEEGIYRRSSDHAPSYVTYGLASEADSVEKPTVDGWVWPVSAADSKPGPCYGGSSVHAGMDINSDRNAVVYAMHAGKVVKVTDGVTGSSPATGNQIMIQTNEGVYYGYQHLLNGSITVQQGDVVSPGQSIAKTGKTGNVQLGSSATHLHITMATTNTTGAYGSLSTTFNPMKYLSAVKPSNYNCTDG